MAITNVERIGKALELLRDGLLPYVRREMEAKLGKYWITSTTETWVNELVWKEGEELPQLDAAALLRLMWDQWNAVFRQTLGFSERSLVSELREARNKWAHQTPFSGDDTYRALDSCSRLLMAVSAPQADEVDRMKRELLRVQFDEQTRNEKRKAGGSLIEAQAVGTLKPWREVVMPHVDVASGEYQQAEFAADLWQVHLGEGSDEYRDPKEFFRRTFLTESLKHLLVGAVKRLSGSGGDPVVQLQTNFGGGKTHSMLALYHLFSGEKPISLLGIEGLMAEARVKELPNVKRVVLVGNKISPGNPSTKSDGTKVRTLWGELAWQLGGKAAYARVQADDERATSPGDVLRQLLKDFGPSLILIDEWVAYARQLHDQNDLPGGSFETQFTFAQTLTESAKLAGNCLLVISLPASDTQINTQSQADDVEVGGLRGREALDRLANVIGRVESAWRPASAEESFEIVRRRLFEPLSGEEAFKQRDVTAQAFADLYSQKSDEFPQVCKSQDYKRRIQSAYPIHPEIFDQLYGNWSTLVKFQRTRGVLRLMAAVIHALWEKGDHSPLILPCMIPIDDSQVQFELTRYLPDPWTPIIEKDVDGPNSLPLTVDKDPRLGKYSAARRVARTIYLGSAPTAQAAHRGIEDRQIRLGCVIPGEPIVVFNDGLRKLANQAMYLYQDGSRYWYATQPTVTRLAEDRAEQLRRSPDVVATELHERLREKVKAEPDKSAFAQIYIQPQSGADVPDLLETRLVILPIKSAYSKEANSAAERAAKDILESRGTTPRQYRNTLVFLAADKNLLPDLDEAIRKYLAWESILSEKEKHNLDHHQIRQAEAQRRSAEDVLNMRLPETFIWLLNPYQANPSAPVVFNAIKTTGSEGLAVRAAKKLRAEDVLTASLAATTLRRFLDQIPLWRGNHVSIKQLAEDFARFVYLPRLTGPQTLAAAAESGVSLFSWREETFACAETYDEVTGRYVALQTNMAVRILPDSAQLLVKPQVASEQRQKDTQANNQNAGNSAVTSVSNNEVARQVLQGSSKGNTSSSSASVSSPRRFYGSIELDPTRVGRDAGRIADEVISHLSGILGADVSITLEIQAYLPEGASESIIRTVSENSQTLKFSSFSFEKE